MPLLLLIVRKGRKSGFIPQAFTFVTDALLQSDLKAYLQAVDVTQIEILKSDLKAVSLGTVANSVQAKDAIAALVDGNVLNTSQVDFYIAVLPSERTVITSTSVLDFRAVVLDKSLLVNSVSNKSDSWSWLAGADFETNVQKHSDLPVYVPRFRTSISVTDTSYQHSYLRPFIYDAVITEATIKPKPSFLVPDNFKMGVGFISYVHPYTDPKAGANKVTVVRDRIALPNPVSAQIGLVRKLDRSALGVPTQVMYTLTWYPPIPVPINARSYLGFTGNEGVTDLPVLLKAGAFATQKGSWTARPIAEKATAYTQIPALITDRKTWVQSKTFNSLITVINLGNMTSSVASQAYSTSQTLVRDATLSTASATPSSGSGVLVRDATLSTASATPSSGSGVLVVDSDLPSVGVDAYSLISGGVSVTSGLVANYDAGNAQSYLTGTSWSDLSGNVNTATLTNTPTFTSVNGGGLVFAGTQYGLTANTASLGLTTALTLEAVINPTALASATQGMGIISKGTSTDGIAASYELMLVQASSKNYLYLRLFTTAQVVCSPKVIAIPLNTTSVVAATWDGSNLHVYVNGVEDGTGTAGSGTLQANTGGLCIGSRFLQKGTASTSGFVGTIYQSQVYNRALSSAEITQNFNSIRTRYGI